MRYDYITEGGKTISQDTAGQGSLVCKDCGCNTHYTRDDRCEDCAEKVLKECDCCGKMKPNVILVRHESFGDTMACEKCRHWED